MHLGIKAKQIGGVTLIVGLAVVALSVLGLAGGCAHHTRAVRGDDEPGLDYAAMSTTLRGPQAP